MENPRESLSESARGLTERLREDGRQTIDTRKRRAADHVEEVANALGRASEQLENQPTLAGYAGEMAQSVGNLATRLRDGSVEQIIDDTRMLARRNPALFIFGSFAAGIALARFLKASGRSTSMDESMGQRSMGEGEFASDFRDASASQEEFPSRAYSPSASTPSDGGLTREQSSVITPPPPSINPAGGS